MFYDRFQELCEAKGVKPGRACIEMGLSRSLAAKWKATKTERPSADVLEKMADYFGMSIEGVLGIERESDPELESLLERLKHRPECRMLFKLTADATVEDVEQAVRIIEAIRKRD